ncbi:MAG: LysR family transcriptional regulator [Mangrovicoccus sp.]|nr:LysR family transcriptional regulator [Mangrovicoccus sp.]
MQSDDLLIFLMVARRGSITAAAQHLAKDAATVGRRIGRLESDLGAMLFAKSPKGYRLTDAGLRLLPQAEALEDLMSDITSGFRDETETVSGRVRIGAPDGCATFLLPQICASLTEANPGLVIDIVATPREVDLLGREVDLAVTLTPARSKGIETLPLADYELHFAAARSAVQGRNPEHLLQELPVITYIPELLIDPNLDIPPELKAPPAMLRSNSVLVQWQWLRQGAGIGLVHDFTLARDPNLVRVLPELAIKRSYFVAARRTDTQFERMRIFREQFIAAVNQELSIPADSSGLLGY